MTAFRLNLPIDIPWTLVDCSRDMMDWQFCDKQTPPPFQSSIALYAYEPKPDELPAELCGRRITYLKVSCSLTGYQPSGAESARLVEFAEALDGVDISSIEAITREYFGCYGVLLNVAVFPFSEKYASQPDLYPHIVDFEPKLRDFYQAATETGEVLTASFNKVATGKSLGSTDSTQSSWKGTANVSVPKEVTGGPTVGLGGETGQVRTEADQENWAIESDASRERREGQSTTTQLSQMYNLLTGYHAGTNRATFVMLPRPHVLQPTDRRTFVQGLRVIEGMQDFFLVVVRNGEEDRIKVDVQLQTGHFPESIDVVDVVPEADQFETRSEVLGPFTKKCLGLGFVQGVVGAVVDGLGGDPAFIRTKVTEGPQVFDGFSEDGWEFDTSQGDAGHKGIEERKLDADTIADYKGLSFHVRTYKREPPDKVLIDVVVDNKNMYPGDGASKARFSREYKVFLRRRKQADAGQTANVASLLVTQRTLCAQIEFGQCIRRVPVAGEVLVDFPPPDWSLLEESDFDLGSLIDVPEPGLPNTREPLLGQARKKALLRKIQASLLAAASSPGRYAPGAVGFLQSRYLQRRLARVLPAKVLDRPARDFDLVDPSQRERMPAEVTVRDLLADGPGTLARKIGGTRAEAQALKTSLFRSRTRKQ
jgi:hypothetical protein